MTEGNSLFIILPQLSDTTFQAFCVHILLTAYMRALHLQPVVWPNLHELEQWLMLAHEIPAFAFSFLFNPITHRRHAVGVISWTLGELAAGSSSIKPSWGSDGKVTEHYAIHKNSTVILHFYTDEQYKLEH